MLEDLPWQVRASARVTSEGDDTMTKGLIKLALAISLMSGNAALADPLAPLPDGTVAVETQVDQTVEAPADTQVIDGRRTDAALTEMAELFGTTELEPGDFRWASDVPASGPTEVIISLSDQMAFVYRGGALIGVTTVSSGKTDHETPTGVFPILAKEKVHKSSKYDDAPMPYMQRLNEYGVAMHGGNLPGYPASHGCVRLPMKFAAKLFTMTQPGNEVRIES